MQNCWEFYNCGRELNGKNAERLGVCPTATHRPSNTINCGTNGGRICWAISGTFCGDNYCCCFVKDKISCTNCEFFQSVKEENEAAFVLLRPGQY